MRQQSLPLFLVAVLSVLSSARNRQLIERVRAVATRGANFVE
jgi:hypothetical protein